MNKKLGKPNYSFKLFIFFQTNLALIIADFSASIVLTLLSVGFFLLFLTLKAYSVPILQNIIK